LPPLALALKPRKAVGRRWFQRQRRCRPNLRTRPRDGRSRRQRSCKYSARSTGRGVGGTGAILRREGLYSSLLTDWIRQRDAGAYDALEAVRCGPEPAAVNPLAAANAQLLRDNKGLALRLQRAEAVIDIQKKVALLLGLPMVSDEES
jgi:hypothetical protein